MHTQKIDSRVMTPPIIYMLDHLVRPKRICVAVFTIKINTVSFILIKHSFFVQCIDIIILILLLDSIVS